MKSIAVFMTQGMSLAHWQRVGILRRELALYERYAQMGVRTLLVSYGSDEDLQIAKDFPFLTVLTNRYPLPKAVYSALLPRLQAPRLTGVEMIKTNQLLGAKQAVNAARLLHVPVVIRQGYSLVDHVTQSRGPNSRRLRQALAYERAWLGKADLCQFTSIDIREGCRARQALDASKLLVVPNYIVDEVWRPAFDHFRELANGEPFRLGFWGRLAKQKNLENLIAACSNLPVELVLAGDGPLRETLAQQAEAMGTKITFLGRLPHERLAAAMRDCDAFILASHLEGHPKALIEAMFFGMPIIAADSPGIRAFVLDGETALVTQTDAYALRSAIEKMRLMSPEDRRRIASNARRFAQDNYSLPAVSRKELAAYRDLLRRRRDNHLV